MTARKTAAKKKPAGRFVRETEAGTLDLPLKMSFRTMEQLLEFEDFDAEGKPVKEQMAAVRGMIEAMPGDAAVVLQELPPADIVKHLQEWFFETQKASVGESQGSAG